MRLRRSRKKHKGNTSSSTKARAKRQSPWRLRIILESLAFVLIGGGIFALWYSGIVSHYFHSLYQSNIALTQQTGLKLQHIYVEGLRQLQPRTIDKTINIRKGSSLLAVDLQAMQARLEKLYWVDEATIERQYPHTLHIHIKERSPMALWQHQQRLLLLDQKGNVIPETNLKPFANLLMLVGDDAPKHSSELFSILNLESDLANQVKAAIRVSERRWNIRLVNGLEIKLPETNPEEAWQYFATFYRKQKLQKHPITSVDLRVPGKLYIRMQPKA